MCSTREELCVEAPAAIRFSVPPRSQTPTKRRATPRARGRDPDARRRIGLSDGSSSFRERRAFDLNVRGDGCTHDGSKPALFRTSVAQPQLRTRTSRSAQACARMRICRLNAALPTWRISRLLFPGTLANAIGGHQMPIRHRGHAGLPRAGLDAPCSLASGFPAKPLPRGMGQYAELLSGTTAFDRPLPVGSVWL
jgi:hypothetical protein